LKKESFGFLAKGQELTAEWYIEKYEEENGIKLDENQKKAVIDALTSESPVYIIAGYAGTGKTTTSKALVGFLKERGKKIVGCALSGAAANRLKSVTGIESYTIHSLLGYRKGKGNGDGKEESMFKHNSENPLEYDLIILDEASMVSAPLVYHLMRAVDTKRTKILMLGDDAQLPPIGWGEVFSDLLEWNGVPKTKLTKIYRQSEDKVISVFAGEIRQGKVPHGYKESGYSDFRFVSFNIPVKLSDLPPDVKKAYRDENNMKIRSYILNGFAGYRDDILKSLKKFEETKDFGLLKEYISRIQLISATKNGLLGTGEMNLEIKNILNPLPQSAKEGIDYLGVRNPRNGVLKAFSKYDKVIHLKNQDMFCSYVSISDPDAVENGIYSSLGERVYNGQVGIIMKVIPKFDERKKKVEDTFVEVYYPNEGYFAYYTKEDFLTETIDLAYSITIHKSQGQEYKSVIVPMTFSHFNMLNAKLVYTAVTRAKDRVILVGEDGAFAVACKRLEDMRRNTNLKHLIQKESEKEIKKEPGIEKKSSENDIDTLPF
jgi:exodeoxyribonuclease V alpha subunit